MKKRLLIPLLLWLCSPHQIQAQLTSNDVSQIIARSASRCLSMQGSQLISNAVVAIMNRDGWVLGVWAANTNLTATDPQVANAIAKAGAAAYLSSGQNAFSSRTAGFIVQQNFPPGILNNPPGPLVGVNFSQLAYSDIEHFKAPGSVVSYGSSPGLTLVPTSLPITGGLAGSPGGVPLYKNGILVGGIGVTGDGHTATDITPEIIASPDQDEDAALAGQTGFQPDPAIWGSKNLVAGIRLEYIESTTSVGASNSLSSLPGGVELPYKIIDSPAPYPYPLATIGGMAGQIRQPIISDPSAVSLGVPRLSATEVSNILAAAANRCRTTRAAIRQPRGIGAQVYISVVNNPNANGVPPTVLGCCCTSTDTTLFSWDVCVQKARTAVFFSASNRAYSARTVGFLAQSHYPPGITGTQPVTWNSGTIKMKRGI